MLLPKPIDDDTRRQWMLAAGQPFGERQTISGCITDLLRRWPGGGLARRSQYGQETRFDDWTGKVHVPTLKHPNRRRLTHVPQCLDFFQSKRLETALFGLDLGLLDRNRLASLIGKRGVEFVVTYRKRL